MTDRTPKLLVDALGAIASVREFVAGCSLAVYVADKMRRSSVEHQSEILGEACARLITRRVPAHPSQPRSWSTEFAPRAASKESRSPNDDRAEIDLAGGFGRTISQNQSLVFPSNDASAAPVFYRQRIKQTVKSRKTSRLAER